jgi:hypothetical protein
VHETPVQGWAGYPLGFVVASAVTTVAVAAGGTVHPLRTLVALAAAAAAIAAVATLRAALATAALCWALHTGFVVGRFGELALTAGTVRAAALLAAVVVFASGIAHAVRVVPIPCAASGRSRSPAPPMPGTALGMVASASRSTTCAPVSARSTTMPP